MHGGGSYRDCRGSGSGPAGQLINNVEETGRLGRSDHSMMTVRIIAELEVQRAETRRADWAGMRDILQQKRWSALLGQVSACEALDILTEKINFFKPFISNKGITLTSINNYQDFIH